MPEVVTGCFHIHTTDSDGTKPIEEVASIADEVGLDFIMVTDHMTLKSLKEGKEGYYGKTLVIIGYEVNDPDNKNHYLIFNLDDVLNPDLHASEYVAQAAEKGGLGVIAHPDEIRGHLPKYPSYPWTEWGVKEYEGIEIWNHMSEWMEGLKKYNKLKMVLYPRKLLKKPTNRILTIWDTVNRERKVAGIGSIDVHGFPYRAGPIRLTIFPYKVQYKSIRTHLLLDRPLSKDLPEAKKQIFRAIRECRIFISNYRWGDASRFYVDIVSGNEVLGIGHEGHYREGAIMNLKLPRPGNIRIIRNGSTYCSFSGESGLIPISNNGLYRVEVTRNDRGWIYSNHIRLV